MTQLFKDMQRDSVTINGVLLRGADGVGTIVSALARRVQTVLHARGGGGGEPDRAALCSDADALTFARDILLVCNRTSSGGDAYEAATLLFACPYSVLCPEGQEARPLRFDVAADVASLPIMEYDAAPDKVRESFGWADSASDSGSEDETARLHRQRTAGGETTRAVGGGAEQSDDGAAYVRTPHCGLVLRFEAMTRYKIVNTDPQDETDESVFGVISLTLVRQFS